MPAKKGLNAIVEAASDRPRPSNYAPAPTKAPAAKRKKPAPSKAEPKPKPSTKQAVNLRMTAFKLSEEHRSVLDQHAQRLGSGRVEIVRALINLLDNDEDGQLSAGITQQVESGSVTLLKGIAAYQAALNSNE